MSMAGNRMIRINLTIAVLTVVLLMPWMCMDHSRLQPALRRDEQGRIAVVSWQQSGGTLEVRFLLDRHLPSGAAGCSAEITLGPRRGGESRALAPVQVLRVDGRETTARPYNVKVSARVGQPTSSIAGQWLDLRIMLQGQPWFHLSGRIPTSGDSLTDLEEGGIPLPPTATGPEGPR